MLFLLHAYGLIIASRTFAHIEYQVMTVGLLLIAPGQRHVGSVTTSAEITYSRTMHLI